MGLTTKPLSSSKARAIRKWACDGVARFTPRGRGVLMSYSDAYDAVLQDAGGSVHTDKDGKTMRTHSGESIRRLDALNLLYLGRPEVREFLQAEQVRIVLAEQAADEAKKTETTAP